MPISEGEGTPFLLFNGLGRAWTVRTWGFGLTTPGLLGTTEFSHWRGYDATQGTLRGSTVLPFSPVRRTREADRFSITGSGFFLLKPFYLPMFKASKATCGLTFTAPNPLFVSGSCHASPTTWTGRPFLIFIDQESTATFLGLGVSGYGMSVWFCLTSFI